MTAPADLVVRSPQGLYCPAGDFHIDPWKPVPCALITHGHGDHARAGMGAYHCTRASLPILRWRLGENAYYAHEYGERFRLGKVEVSLHPAGHVLGSAQVRIDDGRQVWVVSGDYKRQSDPTCAPFAPLACDIFITESTFGLPVYRWPDAADVARDIVAWREACAERGQAALLYCYALGKAQRLLAELMKFTDRPALLHGAIDAGVAVYRSCGIAMLATRAVREEERRADFAGELVLAPPSAAGSPWLRRFRQAQHGFASGWMRLRGNRRRANYDRGFVVSDHADFPDLLRTVRETGARRVIVTHGAAEVFARTLTEQGLAAEAWSTAYGGED